MNKRRIELMFIEKMRLKRFAYHKKQVLRLRRRNRNRKKKRCSSLIKFLENKGFKKRSIIHEKRKTKIVIPEKFSFIENPDESIETLRKIFYLGCNLKVSELYIDHKNVKSLDICASTVMDTIIMAIIEYREKIKKYIDFSGSYSSSSRVKDVLEVSGLLKHLGFENNEPQYIKKLDLIECGRSDVASTQIVEYFNECLGTQNLKLGKRGKLFFSQLVGEVLDNCQLHGGDFSKWYTLGHYFNKGEYGECQLVIFNYGKTIYENLKDDQTSKETINSLNRMSRRHSKLYDKLFWNEEAMWTLYALQDGVSRVRDSKRDPDRGTGTVKFIDSFQQIGYSSGGNVPMMSVISGNISILFDDKYRLKDTKLNGENRKIIAFNNENNLDKRPDRRNVKILKNHFPGTIIAMKFYIDKKYIEKLMEENINEKDRLR